MSDYDVTAETAETPEPTVTVEDQLAAAEAKLKAVADLCNYAITHQRPPAILSVSAVLAALQTEK